MKIALVHYAAPPIVGGVESIMAAHARLFQAAGHEVRVVARRGAADVILKKRDPLPELRVALRGCDVVIVHNVLTMPFDLLLTEALWQLAEKAEIPGARWIAWVHDLAAVNPDYDQPWHKAPWNRLTRICPPFTYVAVSPHRARQLAALMGGEARVIPNGVNPVQLLGLNERVAAFAHRHRLLSREIVLIHPTRLLRRKNVELGLEVLADLRRRGRDAVTLITAAVDPHNEKSTEYAAALRARRAELGLIDSALFVADEFQVTDGDLPCLYDLADVLFFPSRQEGFGLPVVEAALHRLPVFGADVEPVNTLLQHGMHAFDPEATPGELARLIERTVDRSAGHRGRREVLRRYAWDVVWSEHLAPLLGCK